jgi:DNA repair photolyase
MKTREVLARSILSKTNIPGIDYCLNPYTGCAHACRYCYATFMKKFTGHTEAWGSFVDIKINAVDLLKKALRLKQAGEVMLSSVTDPYQPLEKKYELTRGCLELLSRSQLKVSILTKSDLVVRDIGILRDMETAEVGLTIATDDEAIKHIFEPASPTVKSRLSALQALSRAGIQTYAFIGPILPMNPEKLADAVAPFARQILIDRMNYHWKVRGIYKAHNLEYAIEEAFFQDIEARLLARLACHGIDARLV